MCLNPTYIQNQAKSKFGGNEYICVPCRNCRECQEILSQDYTSRAIGEYLYWQSLDIAFSVHFVTFTFAPEYLPKHWLFEEGFPDWNPLHPVDCFDHNLLKTFKNSLRKHYERKNLPSPSYLITCQYGEKKQRPHYHAMIFLPEDLTWRQSADLLLQYWHYGFIKNIKIQKYWQSKERSLINCIKYVTRYCCRYDSNAPSYVFDDGLCLDISPYRYRPRIFTSNNFGAYLHILFNYDQICHGKASLFFDDKYITISFCNYYRRKYFTKTTQQVTFSYYFDNRPFQPKQDVKFWRMCRNETDRIAAQDAAQHAPLGTDYLHVRRSTKSETIQINDYIGVQWKQMRAQYVKMINHIKYLVNQSTQGKDKPAALSILGGLPHEGDMSPNEVIKNYEWLLQDAERRYKSPWHTDGYLRRFALIYNACARAARARVKINEDFARDRWYREHKYLEILTKKQEDW